MAPAKAAAAKKAPTRKMPARKTAPTPKKLAAIEVALESKKTPTTSKTAATTPKKTAVAPKKTTIAKKTPASKAPATPKKTTTVPKLPATPKKTPAAKKTPVATEKTPVATEKTAATPKKTTVAPKVPATTKTTPAAKKTTPAPKAPATPKKTPVTAEKTPAKKTTPAPKAPATPKKTPAGKKTPVAAKKTAAATKKTLRPRTVATTKTTPAAKKPVAAPTTRTRRRVATYRSSDDESEDESEEEDESEYESEDEDVIMVDAQPVGTRSVKKPNPRANPTNAAAIKRQLEENLEESSKSTSSFSSSSEESEPEESESESESDSGYVGSAPSFKKWNLPGRSAGRANAGPALLNSSRPPWAVDLPKDAWLAEYRAYDHDRFRRFPHLDELLLSEFPTLGPHFRILRSKFEMIRAVALGMEDDSILSNEEAKWLLERWLFNMAHPDRKVRLLEEDELPDRGRKRDDKGWSRSRYQDYVYKLLKDQAITYQDASVLRQRWAAVHGANAIAVPEDEEFEESEESEEEEALNGWRYDAKTQSYRVEGDGRAAAPKPTAVAQEKPTQKTLLDNLAAARANLWYGWQTLNKPWGSPPGEGESEEEPEGARPKTFDLYEEVGYDPDSSAEEEEEVEVDY